MDNSTTSIDTRRSILSSMQPVEMADIISHLSEKEQIAIFNELAPEFAVKVFEFLPFHTQKFIINSLRPEQTAHILKEMSPDDRTSFLEELPPHHVSELLKLLPADERAVALKLLGYPENSVGRLMTTDYMAIKMDWSVQQVLDYIRKYGHDSETISILYVTDEDGKLIDDIRLKDFLFAPLNYKVSDLADNKYIALLVNESDEDAIKVFLHYDRTALPVTDDKGFLMGIVTIDDILELVNQVDTEDIQRMGGTEALEKPYMEIAFLELMKKRASWLIVLFLGEMLTATAMGYFEEEMAKAIVLTLFIPLIISSGGNSGSQASTLIIRALALGEVTLKDWWRVMRREVFSGFFLGSILGLIGFLRIGAWSMFTDFYGPHWLGIGFTVSFTLIGVVLWGTLTGAMLPFLLKKVGFDPAVSSAPFVATLVDVIGIIIYFVTASIILHGTLL